MTGANVPCICELGIIACQACQWYFQACNTFYSLSCALNCIAPLRCLQVLLNNRPEATTALLMQLCTPGDSSKPDGDWIAKVSDFAHLAADRYTAAVCLLSVRELQLLGDMVTAAGLRKTLPQGHTRTCYSACLCCCCILLPDKDCHHFCQWLFSFLVCSVKQLQVCYDGVRKSTALIDVRSMCVLAHGTDL